MRPPTLPRGPSPVMVVYHEGVLMFHRSVTVTVSVRLRSFPTLVFVLMMLVMDVQMIVIYRLVPMRQLGRIVSRP